jgi:hypothetical protein
MLADSTTIPSCDMAFATRDPRFIVPACWLPIAAMRLADAGRDGGS